MAMTGSLGESYELGPIRPPSEAYSLLIRVTRNCPWNRCKFCPIYKGAKFQLRSVEEIKRDIDTAKAIHDKIMELAWESGRGDSVREVAAMVCNNAPNDACRNVALWMYAGGKHAFLQDANTLIMKTPGLVDVIKYLKETFPGIDRITSYARSKTASQKSLAELVELREAGLSRIHMGLESGYDPVLAFMDKGVTAADHIAGGKNVVASGISLCEYVMPGAGGKKMWREHALETARVLNEINPDFIRLRTLTIQPRMPLHNDVVSGDFVRSTDEEIVEEEKLLIENLDCRAQVVSDHMMNLLPEVEGKLPEDKEKMLAVIGRFQSLPPEERDNFKLGRRLGIYNKLDDLGDTARHEEVGRVMERLGQNGEGALDEILYNLMERYI
ncbi:MAG TPA: radical SAM protein [Dehalococcoidales bacterium]|nr:radical SAM protein [Dehalococcoidales bacterium]